MQDDLCELRFDVPLSDRDGPRQFERGWRSVLAAQKLTALATPPAQAVAARFRVCGGTDPGEQSSALERYLPARLAALPGAPLVREDPRGDSPDWRGVRVWLSYRSRDLPALLQKSKKPRPFRGHRP